MIYDHIPIAVMSIYEYWNGNMRRLAFTEDVVDSEACQQPTVETLAHKSAHEVQTRWLLLEAGATGVAANSPRLASISPLRFTITTANICAHKHMHS